jgi:hypothetical protein
MQLIQSTEMIIIRHSLVVSDEDGAVVEIL